MLMIKSQSILIWLLWFPANRVIGGQVPGVLVAQAEIIDFRLAKVHTLIQMGKIRPDQNMKESRLVDIYGDGYLV